MSSGVIWKDSAAVTVTWNKQLPRQFCWTRYGTEAGQTIGEIFARKERERQAARGVFLWGIGNSVRPGICELLRHDSAPAVAFSPMRSPPAKLDAEPESVVRWRRATTLDGTPWAMPDSALVLSRGTSSTRRKQQHYALVCYSDDPITTSSPADPLRSEPGQIQFEELVNLVSGNPIGHSQVTAVVKRSRRAVSGGTLYSVGLWARLVYPYFVTLTDPRPV